MSFLTLTYHDLPRLFTLILSVIGIVYLLSTAFKYKKLVAIRFYMPVFLWLLHEVVFYIAYYATGRFSAIAHIELIRVWPQLLHFHGVVTVIGGIAVYRFGILRWIRRLLTL